MTQTSSANVTAAWRGHLKEFILSPGRLPALVVLILLVAVRAGDSGTVEELRLRVFDLMQRLSPRAYVELTIPIKVIEIDEASLAKHGQWPWPRVLLADLVRRIADGQPAALGLDILFAERDRLSPDQVAAAMPNASPELKRLLAAEPFSEERLAEAFARVPTVFGLGPSFEAKPTEGPVRATIVRQRGEDPAPFLQSYPALVRSLPQLTGVERGRGLLGGAPDADGVVRRPPLMVVAEGRLTPALSVELARVAQRRPFIEIGANSLGATEVTTGEVVFPTDPHGRAYPYFSRSLAVRYISASSILDGSVKPAELQGGIFVLGLTGLGLVDVKQTPVGLMQGVEIHVQLLESALTGEMLRRPGWLERAEPVLPLLAGLIVVLAFPYRRAPLAAGLLLGLIAVLALAGFAAFKLDHLLVDTAYPAVSSMILFAVMLGATLRAAEAARRRLAAELQHERELKARLEGELSAARSIQMGLLPRRFPAFPERREIDLHAMIEPARTVGGDLYDFQLLDSNHLFFSIGDVSGKGIPAALFMAMTREALRSSALHHRTALDRVLSDTNAKISSAGMDMLSEGADMMFVTLFAGVINLDNGVLLYANAGHDAPFILDGHSPPRQLSPAGGPPLGCVDDFQYPIETAQLSSGEAVVLFTDGVTEALDVAKQLYSPARLEKVLASQRNLETKGITGAIRDDLRVFVAAAEQADDITMLAVRWLGPAPSPLTAP